jgi:DNA-binding NarL/FixJ family response regulator
MPTVIIADDHPLFREALRGAVARALPEAALVEADGVAAMFQAIDAQSDVDLLLMDLNMPGAHGFSALVQVRVAHPSLPVVIVSAREEAGVIQRALAHGASGFVPKSAEAGTIAQALRTVLDGGRWSPAQTSGSPLSPDEADMARRVAALTPQQFRVLGMLARGLLNKQIAYDLGVSEATIKAHMTAILRKLGASNRTQAVLLAGRLALDPSEVDVSAVIEDE